MVAISPLFRIPCIAIAVGLHAHALNPRQLADFQRNKGSVTEKTVFKSARFITGIAQASRHTPLTYGFC